MLINKYFRVAREGATIDGRKITRDHIDQMAANYSPKIYGARIWLEHLRGLFPDSSFRALGDVVSLKTEDDDSGRRVLLAQLDPTADLIKINQDRQKVYTSIELETNFSDTGEAYLVGLAVTDSPASTGTEMLKFAMSNKEQFADVNIPLVSEPMETNMSFNTEDKTQNQPDDNETGGILAKVQNMFKKKTKEDQEASEQITSDNEKRFIAIEEAIEHVAQEVSTIDPENNFSEIKQTLESVTEQIDEIKKQFADMKQTLEKTPSDDYQQRPPAGGGDTTIQTDC